MQFCTRSLHLRNLYFFRVFYMALCLDSRETRNRVVWFESIFVNSLHPIKCLYDRASSVSQLYQIVLVGLIYSENLIVVFGHIFYLVPVCLLFVDFEELILIYLSQIGLLYTQMVSAAS